MSASIASPFDARSTARDVVRGRNLEGFRVVVTGASSGIGVETALALAEAGAEVIVAVRDTLAGGRVAGPANSRLGAARLSVAQIDLTDFRAIAAFAADILEDGKPLDIVICNAGVMAAPLTRTPAGHEVQFGANHLGHFLMTAMLIPALEAAAQEKGRPSRVVALTSVGHHRSDINWDDPNYLSRPYDRWEAYGQSKTANSLFAAGLTARYAKEGVCANAVMPGGIMTGLQEHLTKEEMIGYGWIDEEGRPSPGMKTVEQGAATSVWAAIGPELEGVGGLYLDDCQVAPRWEPGMRWKGVKDYALDPAAALRLWTLSEELVGFSAP
jgi:NAD(P)-dependent dehydrogenase (short-subunit alcohol dehydrogenase family)